jgi:hypothetical protein
MLPNCAAAGEAAAVSASNNPVRKIRTIADN